MAKLSISYMPIAALAPRKGNPRTHSAKQIEQIAASITRFGFTNPVLVDDGNGIIAGHGRVAAAQRLGMNEVPTIRLSQMSEAEIRAYVIADNKLAENAGWDDALLGIEFRYLAELDIDFDLTITGFEAPVIDALIHEVNLDGDEERDPADEIPPVAETVVTRPGDVWIIGRHRLICGDATLPETYDRLLAGERAQMVFTDPPYNVPIDGHVSGLGKTRHREFAMASGEMSADQFTGFLRTVFENLVTHSVDGSIHFQCMDWRHLSEILDAGGDTYGELKNICVWAKTNGGMGSLYRSRHELVLVFKAGAAPHINNVELGKHGRYRTNVWEYPGVNSFGSNRGDLALHPTVKPVAMVADAILDCSKRKGIVLDAFAGSGTTLVAAEKTGRRGYGVEIDPAYCDVIIRRMRQLFGLEAKLEATDESFEDVGIVRARTEAEGDSANGVDGVADTDDPAEASA